MDLAAVRAVVRSDCAARVSAVSVVPRNVGTAMESRMPSTSSTTALTAAKSVATEDGQSFTNGTAPVTEGPSSRRTSPGRLGAGGDETTQARSPEVRGRRRMVLVPPVGGASLCWYTTRDLYALSPDAGNGAYGVPRTAARLAETAAPSAAGCIYT